MESIEANNHITNPVLHYGLLLLIYGVGLLTLFSHTLFHGAHDHNNFSGSATPVATVKTKNCSAGGKLYRIDIENDHASPKNTNTQLCDKLTFTNHDNVVREIAFGPHEQHVLYDGVAAKELSRNQSFTITLDEVGLFHFHDHFHDEVGGYFDVSN